MSDSKKKPLTVGEVLTQLDRDVVGMPEDLVDAQLAERGMNPGKVAARGRTVLRERLREHKRNAWKKRAEEQRQKLARELDRSGDWLRRRAQQLLDAGHPQIQAAFRDRRPEEMDDEDLRLLAEEQALAELLGEADHGD